MNILDENFPESQRELLQNKRMAVRQIGDDVGRMGMDDCEIIPLLHALYEPTLFTLDRDFYNRHWCHAKYCLVYLDIHRKYAAEYVLRVLRHSKLNSKAKRMGKVIRVLPSGLAYWQVRQEEESHLLWEKSKRSKR